MHLRKSALTRYPLKVRYLWTKLDADHARCEQAFSYGDRTWETNPRATSTTKSKGQQGERIDDGLAAT